MFPQPSAILSVLRSLRPRASRWVLLLLGIFLAATAGISQSSLPSKPQGYVNDFAGVLNPSARAQLTALCTEVDQKTHAQIAVVTVPSLDGKPVEDYAVDLATKWGVGPKQSSRGVLILLAIKDHKYRTEVGYGLEPILPDGKVGGFGREAVPLLRQGNYDAALLLMTRLVANVIAQDSHVTLTGRPPLIRVRRRSSPPFPVFFWLILFVFWLISSVLRRLIPSSRRRGSGWWMVPMMMGGMRGGGWGGGGFGGGGGGGGGFGGFGGGSFGGGGAGGSW